MILKVIHNLFQTDGLVPETPVVERASRTTGTNLNNPRAISRRSAARSPSGRAIPSLGGSRVDWPRDIAVVTESSFGGDTVQIREKLYPVFDTASRHKVLYTPKGRTFTMLADPAPWPVSIIISFDWFPSTRAYEWSPVRGSVMHGILEKGRFLELESEGGEAFEGLGLKATHISGTAQELELRSGNCRCTEFQFYHPKDLYMRYRLSVYYVWNKNSRRLHSMFMSENVLDFLYADLQDSRWELLRSKKNVVESEISRIEGTH